MKNFEKIFQQESIIYLEVIDEIVNEVNSVELQYLYEKAYKKVLRKDVSEGHKIYWNEIIGNAYLASLMSMFRHKQWVLGIVQSYNNQNYLAFSANLRGLLESVSDSNFSLKKIPGYLTKFSNQIENAIKKVTESHSNSDKDYVFIVCSELEEALLHFFYAEKLKNKADRPSYHRADTNTNYINSIEHSEKYLELYSELCQITHPAMPSVMDFFEITESEYGYTNTMNFKETKCTLLIDNLINKYQHEIESLLALGFNYPLAILREINKMNIEEFTVRTINNLEYKST